MLNKATAGVVSLLILLVVVTGWYAASLTRFTPFSAGGLINMGALSQANVIQTTDAGTIQYKGSITQATEFNNGNINFVGLDVTFYGQGKAAPMTLKSDTGEVLDDNKQINLFGNVNLSQPAIGNNPPLLIQTDSASLFPDTDVVQGAGLITFLQPGTINKMQGVGFVANLQEQWVKLLSQVKGIYAPK